MARGSARGSAKASARGIARGSSGGALPESLAISVDESNPQAAETITFTATPGFPSYVWKRNGSVIAGETSSTLEFLVDWINHDNAFTCEASELVSNSVAITVDEQPALTEWDYYIATTGNNANAGTSEGAAWADFTPLQTLIASQEGGAGGVTFRVKIAVGSYEGGLNAQMSSDTTLPVIVYLDFASGCTISKGSSGAECCLQAFRSTDLYVLGNGLTITGFSAAADGNGLGAFSGGRLYAWNVSVTDAVDGWSCHGNSYSKCVDCTFSGGTKSAFAHIDGSTGVAARCTFTGLSGASLGIGRHDQTTVFEYHDCTFVPAADQQNVGLDRCLVKRCKLGTVANAVTLASATNSSTRGDFYDCFIHGGGTLGGSGGSWTRCYGGRNGWLFNGDSSGAPWVIRNCVLRGKGTSGDYLSFLVANSDSGSEAVSMRDTVFTNWAVAVGQGVGSGFSATSRTHFNANSEVRYCSLFGNGTNLADWITSQSDNITTDPVLGPMDTMDQADWAIDSAGPCVGASSTGGNIGFTLADIPV